MLGAGIPGPAIASDVNRREAIDARDKCEAEPFASELSSDIRRMRAARVKRLIHERNRRAEYFRADIFSDPAWDVLLELYNSELSQDTMTVAQLGMLSNVPPTTAVHWIKVLECENLVIRVVPPRGSNSVSVELTRKGGKAMNSYFRGGPGE